MIPRFTPLQFHEGAQSCCLIFIEPFTCYGEVRHAVKSECAEILPELAPSGKHPAIGQIPNHERAHAALGLVPIAVLIVELRDLPLADRLAEQSQIRRCAGSALKTEVRRISELTFLWLRHTCLDFRARFASRCRQHWIAGAFHEGKTYGKRIDLVMGKRHIGQVKARSQQITNAGLTFNRQAGGLEVGNVAIDRADAYFKMLSKFVGSADAAGPHLVD